ncbi:MAG: aspartate-semialdehyde dehydrogenase [Halobacteriovoraceae bacterium]|nr:aspartate-semialdehyde dehydrogenase [Halobacteriovoraceae bacterium]
MNKSMKLGLVGYRGMVGSVLLKRMLEEKDFLNIDPIFFSTTNKGNTAPNIGKDIPLVQDSFDLKLLEDCDIIINCQGKAYTHKIYSKLRRKWQGYWIDASSALRMQNNVILSLDPINLSHIQKGLKKGIKTFSGANCTVSLMLLALHGLFKENLVEWVSTMTYQAVSGAGAGQMKELAQQIKYLNNKISTENSSDPLKWEQQINHVLKENDFPQQELIHPLSYNLHPWIDDLLENGQSKEEWKGSAEGNKILCSPKTISIDGTCVRIPTLRCHCQAMTIKLTKNIPLNELTQIIDSANPWTFVVPNTKKETLKHLTPVAISNSLSIPVGRLRKMSMGNKFLNAFSVGDQLLWGAAEPLRRTFKIIQYYKKRKSFLDLPINISINHSLNEYHENKTI